jgi:L-aminopeptidase/D-esterase-like protein
LVAVNSFGFIGAAPSDSIGEPWDPSAGQNTTIGLILTNAVVDKLMCHRLAHAGHSGYAKATFPSHTAVDGDAVVATATGSVPNHFHPMWLRAAAESAMTTAVLSVA